MYIEYLKEKNCPKISNAAPYKTPHCIIGTLFPSMLTFPMKPIVSSVRYLRNYYNYSLIRLIPQN